MLETIERVFKYSHLALCNALYDEPSFEPNFTTIVIRVTCISLGAFIVYQSWGFIKNDCLKYERIYANISNASTLKILNTIFLATISLITGYQGMEWL